MVAADDGEGERLAPAPALRKERGRSHSEAERKRRQRINAHLATLRALVPSASRMDKAALLGEVVRYVRELHGKATRWASRTTTTACGRGGSGRGCAARTARGSCPTWAAPCGPSGTRALSAPRLPPSAGGHAASWSWTSAATTARAVALSTLRAALRSVLINREEHEHRAAEEGYKRPRFSSQIAKVQRTDAVLMS